MDNLIWINGRQIPFVEWAIPHAVFHTDLGLEIEDLDWWNHCFGGSYWSEWSVVLRLRCLQLTQLIAAHPTEVAEVLSQEESPTLPRSVVALTQILDSLENIVRETTGWTVSIWTLHSLHLDEANAAFANVSDESQLKTLIGLPHIDRFLCWKQHEEKSARKKAINARADFNRWKKRQGYR